MLGLPDCLDHAGRQADAASQPNFVKIQQGMRISQRLRQRLSGSLQQPTTHRVARVPTGKDRCRVNRPAEQMRRLPGKRRARRYRLQAIEPATAAAGVAVQRGQPTAHMADVAGQAAQSAAQLAAQHQATADSGRQGHEQQVAGLPVARHKLAPGRRLRVIQQNRRAMPGLRQGISQPIAVPK